MKDIERITISAVGDICLGMGVREEVEAHGASYVFRNVLEKLAESDLRIGNLEVVFPGSEETTKSGHSDIWAYDNAIHSLTEVGFDILTLGNNHIMDFGSAGLENTIKLLDENGILHTGANMNDREACRPVVMDMGFMKVGVLSYADDEGQIAGTNKPGVAETVEKNIIKEIRNLKNKVDAIILSLHTGLEFEHFPEPYKAALARKAISEGANIVLCHHPHVLQGIEVYKDALICYSLGNFVFHIHDNEYQRNHLPYTAWSVIVKIQLSKKGYISHSLLPVVIAKDHCPTIARYADHTRIIEHIARISKPLGNEVCLEKLYRSACWRCARENYWSFRVMLRAREYRAIIRRLWMLITRSPHRRWIFGFVRCLLLGLNATFKEKFDEDCSETIHVDVGKGTFKD